MTITTIKPLQLRVEEQGFALLFDPQTRTTYNLNPTASWLWAQIKPGVTLQTILQSAQNKYNITPDDMHQTAEEIVDCILSWWMDGLLTITAANRPLEHKRGE